MPRTWLVIALLLCSCCPREAPVRGPMPTSRLDPQVEPKVEALLAQMTLEEKIGQLTQFSGDTPAHRALVKAGKVGSLLNVVGASATNEVQHLAVEQSRLHIPLLFGFDTIHGYKTIFPIPLASASSWDPALIEQSERVAGEESAAAGLRWVFAPMVDIARDPRWGRIAEGAGEDPFLGAALAAARVRGFQGTDPLHPRPVLACAKHFVGYGAVLAGRDYHAVDVSERALREIHLKPFHAAVEAGVGSLMSAFNELNGVPASGNPFTLTTILRGEWGFPGFVVSDWNSVRELIPHGLAATPADAAREALTAGVDMDMVGGIYPAELARLVRAGQMPIRFVDEAVRRILRMKFAVGLFAQPYTDPAGERSLLNAAHQQRALEMARKSIVLLKNEGVLPLSPQLRQLAVIGPLADDHIGHMGSWRGGGNPEHVVTLLTALKAKLAAPGQLSYAKGCEIRGGSTAGLAEAVALAKAADAVVAVLGEEADMSGEAASRTSLELPGHQLALLEALRETGKPLVLVLMNGRPLTLARADELAPAILEAWALGTQAGPAIAEALLGELNPGGKLPVSFPRSVGQIPLYYSQPSGGRPATASDRFTSKYLDAPNTPLYPFGHGLSYTRFAYRELALSARRLAPDGQLTVQVTVQNIGKRAGDEVVQLYVQDVAASVTRPVRELRGFQRVSLAPGESRRLSFTLSREHLGFWNRAMQFVVEPGRFKLWVGGSSVGGLEGSFTVVPPAQS